MIYIHIRVYFHETKPIVYSDDLFDDFLVQLGRKNIWRGIFHSFSYSNIKQWEDKVPIFLGGEDDVSNLEDSDMEVYWEIMPQIAAQL